MASEAKLAEQRKALLERIEALKQEILDNEPTLANITLFVQENHPQKQEQYAIEQQLRQAQNELTDIEQVMKQVVI